MGEAERERERVREWGDHEGDGETNPWAKTKSVLLGSVFPSRGFDTEGESLRPVKDLPLISNLGKETSMRARDNA